MSAESRPTSTSGSPKRVMGLEKVIAFYGAYPELESQAFTRGGDWEYWQARGGIVSEGVVHYNFLRKNVDEAADVLARIDFADNPNPVVKIDEFGWDYDGGIDQHTAAILQAVHEKRPDLKITVWQMRGPVAPELAAVYRQTVELVLLETYFDLNDAWMIPFQLQAARLTGLLDQCVVALGLGKESEDKGDHRWTQTAEELEQQIRLIRFVAPESPGVGFFGKWKLKENNCPLTDEQFLGYLVDAPRSDGPISSCSGCSAETGIEHYHFAPILQSLFVQGLHKFPQLGLVLLKLLRLSIGPATLRRQTLHCLYFGIVVIRIGVGVLRLPVHWNTPFFNRVEKTVVRE